MKFYTEPIEKSPRIQKLIDALYEKMPQIEADRAVLLTESYKATEGEPIITRRAKAFALGALSGLVEPIAAVITMLFLRESSGAMPVLLAFAAGAMLYVVVEELIPEMSEGEHSNIGVIFFALGFSLMMVLDVALG